MRYKEPIFEIGDKVIVILNDSGLEPKHRLKVGKVIKLRGLLFGRGKPFGYIISCDKYNIVLVETAIPDYVLPYSEELHTKLGKKISEWQFHHTNVKTTKKELLGLLK